MNNCLLTVFFYSDNISVLQCNTNYMRCVVTISLPEDMCTEVEKQMKKLKFENKSEFIRFLLRYWLERNK